MASAGSQTSQATFKQKIPLSQMLKIVTSAANLFIEEKGSLCFGTINVEMCQEDSHKLFSSQQTSVDEIISVV